MHFSLSPLLASLQFQLDLCWWDQPTAKMPLLASSSFISVCTLEVAFVADHLASSAGVWTSSALVVLLLVAPQPPPGHQNCTACPPESLPQCYEYISFGRFSVSWCHAMLLTRCPHNRGGRTWPLIERPALWLFCWGFNSWAPSASTFDKQWLPSPVRSSHLSAPCQSVLLQVGEGGGVYFLWPFNAMAGWSPAGSPMLSILGLSPLILFPIVCKLYQGHPASVVAPSWSLQQESGPLHSGHSGCRWSMGCCPCMKGTIPYWWGSQHEPPLQSSPCPTTVHKAVEQERGQHTWVFTSKSSNVLSAVLTQQYGPVYSSFIMSIIQGGTMMLDGCSCVEKQC